MLQDIFLDQPNPITNSYDYLSVPVKTDNFLLII